MLNVTGCDYVYRNFYHLPKIKTTEAPPIDRIGEDVASIQPASGGDETADINKNATNNITIEKIRDNAVRLSKNDTDFSVNPIEINIEKPTANLKTDPKGLVTDLSLIDKEEANSDISADERLNKMEQRIENIATALEKMSPAITRLINIESELDALTFQLEALLERGNIEKLAQVQPPQENSVTSLPFKAQQSEKSQPTEETKALEITVNNTPQTLIAPQNISPAAGVPSEIKPLSHTSQSASLYKLRSGEHIGKTRLVFESNQKISPDVQIDNNEKIMLVNLGDAIITPAFIETIEKTTKSSNILQAAKLLNNNDEPILAFDLKKNSNVISREFIAPSAESKNHRFVLDISR